MLACGFLARVQVVTMKRNSLISLSFRMCILFWPVGVLSEEQIRLKKLKKQQEEETARTSTVVTPTPPQEAATLDPQQQEMIQKLVAMQKQCNKRSFLDRPKVTVSASEGSWSWNGSSYRDSVSNAEAGLSQSQIYLTTVYLLLMYSSLGHRVRICRIEKCGSSGSLTSLSWQSCQSKRLWILLSSFPVSLSSQEKTRLLYWRHLLLRSVARNVTFVKLYPLH